jgi:hypothetical protein
VEMAHNQGPLIGDGVEVAKAVCGDNQLYVGLEARVEGGIHAM